MYDLMKHCFLFQHLNPEQLSSLIQNIKYRTAVYKKGQYIDNFSRELGIVLKGKIEVQKNFATGKKIIMNKLKVGNVFGIAYLFHENIDNVTILLSNSEATILFIEENELLRLFQLDSILLRNYLSYVNQRIYFLNQRVECFTHEKIRDRVIEFLEQQRIQQNNQSIIILSFTKSELAEYLGVSRPSLYRVLKDLEVEGYIELNGNKILFYSS